MDFSPDDEARRLAVVYARLRQRLPGAAVLPMALRSGGPNPRGRIAARSDEPDTVERTYEWDFAVAVTRDGAGEPNPERWLGIVLRFADPELVGKLAPDGEASWSVTAAPAVAKPLSPGLVPAWWEVGVFLPGWVLTLPVVVSVRETAGPVKRVWVDVRDAATRPALPPAVAEEPPGRDVVRVTSPGRADPRRVP